MVRCKSRSRPRGSCCTAPLAPCANSGGSTVWGSRKAPWVKRRLAPSSICLRMDSGSRALGAVSLVPISGCGTWSAVFRAGSLRGLALTLTPFGPPTAEQFYLLPVSHPTYFARTPAALARISHRTGFLREGGEVQVTESRRDRRLSVAGGRKTACNATKRRIPTSVGILCLLRQAS